MENVFVLILRHKKLEVIKMAVIEEQLFVFEDKETMETWLRNKGFVYGHCDGYANIPGKFYWFHQKDTPIDMVEVEIQRQEIINSNTVSEGWRR